MNTSVNAPYRRYWRKYRSQASFTSLISSSRNGISRSNTKEYIRQKNNYPIQRRRTFIRPTVKKYRNFIISRPEHFRFYKKKEWKKRSKRAGVGIFLNCHVLLYLLGFIVATAVAIEMSIYLSIKTDSSVERKLTTEIYEETTTIVEDTTVSEEPIQILNYHSIYTNQGDYRLFSLNDEMGNIVTVYGEKDLNGSLVTIDLLEYTPNSGSKLYMVLNEQSLVTHTVADNLILQLQWSADLANVSGSAITSNGSVQANFKVDLSNISKDTTYSLRRKRSLDIEDEQSFYGPSPYSYDNSVQDVFDTNIHVRNKRQASTLPQIKLRVSVESCKELVTDHDAFVVAKIFTNYKVSGSNVSWSEIIEIPGKAGELFPNYPGFHIYLPLNPAGTLLPDMCSAIEREVPEQCINMTVTTKLIKKACVAMENSFNYLQVLTTSEMEDIVKSCNNIVNGIDLLCSGFISSDDLSRSIFNSSCVNTSNLHDFYTLLPGQFLLKPYAVLSDGIIQESMNTLPIQLGAHLANIFYLIDAGFSQSFQVSSVITTPADPDPKQSYTTTTKYRCTFFGSVHMYVAGTDDYENAVKCDVLNTCSCCELKVPGAEAYVHDKWTVRYKDLNGITVFERRIAVVF